MWYIKTIFFSLLQLIKYSIYLYLYFLSEIFKIKKVQITNPVTYILEDYQGQPIAGAFYEYELLKAKYKDVYLVEKILKTENNKVFVKWLGFPANHNSWINKTDLLWKKLFFYPVHL